MTKKIIGHNDMELMGFKANCDFDSEYRDHFYECCVADKDSIFYVYFILDFRGKNMFTYYVTDHSVSDKLYNIEVEDGRDAEGLEYLEAYNTSAAAMTSRFYPFFRMMRLVAEMKGFTFSSSKIFSDIVIEKKCFYNNANDYCFDGIARFKLDGKDYISTVRFSSNEDDAFETNDINGIVVKESVVEEINNNNPFRPIYARITEELYNEEKRIEASLNGRHIRVVSCADETCDAECFFDVFDQEVSPVLTYDEVDACHYSY